MNLYRIAKAAHARDLSGIGARIYGARWNRKGPAVLYTATSPALATVELLVHVDVCNVLVDPAHPEFNAARITKVTAYTFDERLSRRRK